MPPSIAADVTPRNQTTFTPKAGAQPVPTPMVGLRKLRAEPGMDLCKDIPLPELGPDDVLVKVQKGSGLAERAMEHAFHSLLAPK